MTEKLMNLSEQVRQFWTALDLQQYYLSGYCPAEYGPDVYVMRTKPGFIFDDSFWEVFQSFPFKICHVAYYGPERILEEDRREDTGVFELRWSLQKEAA